MVRQFCFISWRQLMEKCCTWDNGSVWLKVWPCKIYGSVTYISWSTDFALYYCHRLKLFIYIKNWLQSGIFVSLRALTLVITYANSEGPGEPAHPLSVTRTFIVGSHDIMFRQRAGDLALLDGCVCVFQGSQTAWHKGPFSHVMAH